VSPAELGLLASKACLSWSKGVEGRLGRVDLVPGGRQAAPQRLRLPGKRGEEEAVARTSLPSFGGLASLLSTCSSTWRNARCA